MTRIALLLLLSWLLAQPVRAQNAAYWVWQRTEPLSPPETSALKSGHVSELYWHVGTISWTGAAWHWREHFPVDWAAIRASCPGIAVIPVLRIEASGPSTFPPPSRPALRQVLEKLRADAGAPKLQIDYESPDRLIDEYAGFLHELKDQGRSWRLSISALAHWSKYSGPLAGCADEITPMFYDLDPKSERLGPTGMPPLVDPAIGSQLASWRGFPIPWKAGLPNFSRVTVIAPDGKSRGNLRGWSWDDIYFASFLQPCGATSAGQALFTVSHEGLLGFTPVHPQEHLDVRYPDRGQLRQAAQQSLADGAQGVVYFRLADENDPSGYSAADISAAPESAPALRLTQDASGRYVLANTGGRDLMPVLNGAGPQDRGYVLELEAQTPIWREAIAGDFAQASLSNAANPSTGSQHLELCFSHLMSGHHLTTGYIDEADHPKALSLRWRVRNLSQGDSWHQLD
jgi:hypothetical protein